MELLAKYAQVVKFLKQKHWIINLAKLSHAYPATDKIKVFVTYKKDLHQ